MSTLGGRARRKAEGRTALPAAIGSPVDQSVWKREWMSSREFVTRLGSQGKGRIINGERTSEWVGGWIRPVR